jgi:hypothetical protein
MKSPRSSPSRFSASGRDHGGYGSQEGIAFNQPANYRLDNSDLHGASLFYELPTFIIRFDLYPRSYCSFVVPCIFYDVIEGHIGNFYTPRHSGKAVYLGINS